MIGKPGADVTGIPDYKPGFTRVHVDPIDVKDPRISLVVLYQHVIGVALQIVHD